MTKYIILIISLLLTGCSNKNEQDYINKKISSLENEIKLQNTNIDNQKSYILCNDSYTQHIFKCFLNTDSNESFMKEQQILQCIQEKFPNGNHCEEIINKKSNIK